ncbi:MAG: serine--tRNA ligase [Planctomycetes bacterium]|nr:serine--tRNA ligase [Planctomycetota bacterium]
MLDRKYIVDHAEEVKENCARRGAAVDVDRLVEIEELRRAKLQDVQELNRRANEVAKSIGSCKDPTARAERVEEGRRLRDAKDTAQSEHDRLDDEALAIQTLIPNRTHPDAPIGTDDGANREVGRGAAPVPDFAFKPLDHVQLAERHALIDFEAGARIAGHGFYFLKNEAVLLELALQQFAVGLLIQKGFTPVITPDLAYTEILNGVGFIPRGPETQIYSIENSNLNLVATSEITLGGMYSGATLDEDQLPIRFCGLSHCFRTEAGAAGRASRGLYRVHQFTKVEMFAFTTPDQSDAVHEELCAIERELFDRLGIPFRVVDTATGDLGGPAYRKYDLEAWMPGRGERGEWGEVTSTSNCTDYQARRLNIRFRKKAEKGTHFVHTLNGTAVAVSRAMIAILENHQQVDGTILVPDVLRPFVGKDRIG